MIKITDLNKNYKTKYLITEALNNICLDIKQGEFTAIMGPFWVWEIYFIEYTWIIG